MIKKERNHEKTKKKSLILLLMLISALLFTFTVPVNALSIRETGSSDQLVCIAENEKINDQNVLLDRALRGINDAEFGGGSNMSYTSAWKSDVWNPSVSVRRVDLEATLAILFPGEPPFHTVDSDFTFVTNLAVPISILCFFAALLNLLLLIFGILQFRCTVKNNSGF